MKSELSDKERLDGWETLINSIEKTDIPMEFIRNISIMFHAPVENDNEQDINIQQFRKDGFDDNGLEEIVAEVFKEHDNNIKAVHFYLDVEHVANEVQAQTNQLLRGLR